jgi:hypothetical protein
MMFGGSGVGRKGGTCAMLKAAAFCAHSIAESAPPQTSLLSIRRVGLAVFFALMVFSGNIRPVRR